MPQVLDPRKVLSGYQGELYSEDGKFLAQVNTFRVQINQRNTDYQPAGSPLEVAIPQAYQVTLTLTETVVDDAILLQRLLTALRAGQRVAFGFQGVLRGADGRTGRYVFRSCVPDGNIDIVNVSPGDIITREWNFRVNEPPEIVELLTL